MLKNLARQMEEIVTSMENMSLETLENLPTNRFRKDLIADLTAAGISPKDSELIALRAKITLSQYDEKSEDFKSIRRSFVRLSLFGRDKLSAILSDENKNEWVKLLELSLEV